MIIKLEGEVVDTIQEAIAIGYFGSPDEVVNSVIAYMLATEISNTEEVINLKLLIADAINKREANLVNMRFKKLLKLLNIDITNIST